MSVGPLKTLKNALNGNDQHLVAFHGIHVNFWAKMAFSSLSEACGAAAIRNGTIKLVFHANIVEYLRTIDNQPQYCVKIVSSLPKQITEQYYLERNATGYEIPIDQEVLNRMTTKAITAPKHESSIVGSNPTDVNKYELLGRPLSTLQTVTINYPDGYKE